MYDDNKAFLGLKAAMGTSPDRWGDWNGNYFNHSSEKREMWVVILECVDLIVMDCCLVWVGMCVCETGQIAKLSLQRILNTFSCRTM